MVIQSACCNSIDFISKVLAIYLADENGVKLCFTVRWKSV